MCVSPVINNLTRSAHVVLMAGRIPIAKLIFTANYATNVRGRLARGKHEKVQKGFGDFMTVCSNLFQVFASVSICFTFIKIHE